MATSDMQGQSAAESSVVTDVQSRLSSLNIGEDVEEEMAMYMKITIMRECKQDMLAIGPTPKLDKAIKALEDAVVVNTETGVDGALLDKGSEATETVSASELTPQTSAEPSETYNEYINTPVVNIRPTTSLPDESLAPRLLSTIPCSATDLTANALEVSEANTSQWSKGNHLGMNRQQNISLCYWKYRDGSQTHVQFRCQEQGSATYEVVILDLEQLSNIHFCIAHSYLEVVWTAPVADGSDFLAVYPVDKSSGKAFYDFLEENLKGPGCRFSTQCRCW